MINTTSRSQKIRNAIAALLTAASTLIAAEAGAMYKEDELEDFHVKEYRTLNKIYDGSFTRKIIDDINDLAIRTPEDHLKSITTQNFSATLREAHEQVAIGYSGKTFHTRNNICNFIKLILQEEQSFNEKTQKYIVGLLQDIYRYLYY
ncbi:hypothetical protein Bealeia2_02052 (plasmid) [Candidatus Bealeia paramacronuclearis]|nr:hypothetical protein [Candidatus Bealeia paramacronuclearis]